MMEEWQLVPVESDIQKPLVTIRNRSIGFNTYFVKVANLEKESRVTITVKPNSMQIGFQFHDDPNIRDSYTLTKDYDNTPLYQLSGGYLFDKSGYKPLLITYITFFSASLGPSDPAQGQV